MEFAEFGIDRFNRSRRASRSRLRFEARLAERERIARELHDTILQVVQSLMLRFQAVASDFPVHESQRRLLEVALNQATQAIEEGRDAIAGLRSFVGGPDLATALRTLGEGLAQHTDSTFECIADREPLPLHPYVSVECYRVGAQALFNAFKHARAKRITAQITHERRGLRLRVTDNGCGFDPRVVQQSRETWGLTGMRERATNMDARFSIKTCKDEGTVVELLVPRAIAYARLPSRLGGSAHLPARSAYSASQRVSTVKILRRSLRVAELRD